MAGRPSTHTHPAAPAATGLQGVLKLLRTPGSSAGVGRGKQVLFTLQMRPWSQGTVPADGSGLLGKWPAGTPDVGFSPESTAWSQPRGQSAPLSHYSSARSVLRTLTGAPVHRVTTANPNPNPKVLDAEGLTFMLLEWGVGMAYGHQDEEEKDWPHQLHQELHLRGQNRRGGVGDRGGRPGRLAPAHPTRHYRLPPAVQEIIPKQQQQLRPEGHGGNGQETGLRGQAKDILCGCWQLPVPL